MSVIETIIKKYAELRGVSVETVRQEVAQENESTMSEIFKLVCAFEACK